MQVDDDFELLLRTCYEELGAASHGSTASERSQWSKLKRVVVN